MDSSPPRLPGDLARAPSRGTGHSQVPRGHHCPGLFATFLKQAPCSEGSKAEGRLPLLQCGDKAESPACPSSTSAGTTGSERDLSREEGTTVPLWPRLKHRSDQGDVVPRELPAGLAPWTAATCSDNAPAHCQERWPVSMERAGKQVPSPPLLHTSEVSSRLILQPQTLLESPPMPAP